MIFEYGLRIVVSGEMVRMFFKRQLEAVVMRMFGIVGK